MLKAIHIMIAALLWTGAAAAQTQCDSCRAADEQQIGNYVEPDSSLIRPAPKIDTRGNEVRVPLPGAAASVYVRPGAGMWLGSPGKGRGDVFLKGGRDKASVEWRLGF